jgi:hypothetical protein
LAFAVLQIAYMLLMGLVYDIPYPKEIDVSEAGFRAAISPLISIFILVLALAAQRPIFKQPIRYFQIATLPFLLCLILVLNLVPLFDLKYWTNMLPGVFLATLLAIVQLLQFRIYTLVGIQKYVGVVFVLIAQLVSMLNLLRNTEGWRIDFDIDVRALAIGLAVLGLTVLAKELIIYVYNKAEVTSVTYTLHAQQLIVSLITPLLFTAFGERMLTSIPLVWLVPLLIYWVALLYLNAKPHAEHKLLGRFPLNVAIYLTMLLLFLMVSFDAAKSQINIDWIIASKLNQNPGQTLITLVVLVTPFGLYFGYTWAYLIQIILIGITVISSLQQVGYATIAINYMLIFVPFLLYELWHFRNRITYFKK